MAICRVAKRGFYSFANKNICDEREEVSHARCAKFIYSNTIKSFLRAFFQKSENLYLTNFLDKSQFVDLLTNEKGAILLLLIYNVYLQALASFSRHFVQSFLSSNSKSSPSAPQKIQVVTDFFKMI